MGIFDWLKKIKNIENDNGLSDVSSANNMTLTISSGQYFSFFPPLFLLIVLYEEIVRLLGIKLLCSDFWVEISHDND